MMELSMIGRAAFAGAVALALGLGAREAAAAPEAQVPARRPYCSSQEHCQTICERMYPGYDGFGFCSSGSTCYC
jgi:uncharacterized membrane protein